MISFTIDSIFVVAVECENLCVCFAVTKLSSGFFVPPPHMRDSAHVLRWLMASLLITTSYRNQRPDCGEEPALYDL